ncbi:glycosyltransferase family 4 protein [Dyella sp. AD56]|uniref:glycosyltransferase family 4 protein n=1 Tax=Dyella sp. AD56 TaxID=1528744 RepID=UPI000C815F4B|nr:glycosyltransferase family 4 protein [Dyella sp. AD56]
MKVLMLGWELPPSITGGLGMACDGLLRGISDVGGVSVQFMLPAPPMPFANYPPTIGVLQLDGCEEPQPAVGQLSSAYEDHGQKASRYAKAVLRSFDRINEFDLIHAHDWLTFEAALHVKRMTGKPLVVHIHSTEQDRSGYHPANPAITALERDGMDAASRIVAVSRYTKNSLVHRYGQAADKIDVIYNAGDRIEMQSPTPSEGCISFIGRMTEQKGPEIFVEAASRIHEVMPDARFVMAGDGNLMPMIRSLVRSLGLKDVFSFPGFIDREAVSQLLQRSRVLIMPSLSEPFGLVALEAIHAGVPVVLTRNSGLSEQIENVIRVDPEDIDAITEATIQLMRDPDRALAQAKAAAQEAAHLNWTKSATALLGVYRSVIA